MFFSPFPSLHFVLNTHLSKSPLFLKKIIMYISPPPILLSYLLIIYLLTFSPTPHSTQLHNFLFFIRSIHSLTLHTFIIIIIIILKNVISYKYFPIPY